MPTPHLAIRLSPAKKKRWEEAASDAGQNVSDFVRDTIDAKIAGKAAPARPSKAAAECPRARFHRPGSYCKFCETVP